jgi:hypothetical protein
MIEELRRIARLTVCCRVTVRDRYGVWTAVTEDVSERGCRIVTPRMLRQGTLLDLTLSSDLFEEELEVRATTAWAGPRCLAALYVDTGRRAGAISPAEWMTRLLEHGATGDTARTARLVPSLAERPAPAGAVVKAGRIVRPLEARPPPPPRFAAIAPRRRA